MIGLVLPTREALRAGTPGLVPDFAVAAEQAGFDSVWAGDSLLARPLYDPFVTLAIVAARTSRVKIGTGALLAPLRPAVTTAHAIASLDQYSGGRVILGIGRGFDLPETRREFAAAGASFDDRSKRFVSTIRDWRTMWSSGGDIDLLPKPAQAGGPPIWIAGNGPVAFRNVARLADGWLPYPPTPGEYADGLAQIYDAARAAGRDPSDITPAMMMTVAPDEAQLSDYVAEFYGYPLELVSMLQCCRHGDAQSIVQSIGEYWDAGARTFLIRLASLEDPIGALERFASQVLPQIRALSGEVVTT